MPAIIRNRGPSEVKAIIRFSSAASRGLRVDKMCWIASLGVGPAMLTSTPLKKSIEIRKPNTA
ncbi:MAG TPA: hypothetical protein PKM73_10000 [Verrucomicrobiota bacterium]|nr:hypothetical protein [Verrucomicrobiota bacterium]HNU51691.1 hypothetical protein [Verrucomicrobiota bacterium]